MARTPLRRSSATARLMLSASSRNCSPATPVGVTMVGVSFSTAPMKPTETSASFLITNGGSSVLPVAASTTFAQTYG